MVAPNYSGLAIYERLALKIKTQVLQGVLQPSDKLPSVREMALQEQLNPNTVAKTYKLLEEQQVIYVEPGKGSFVSQMQTTADERTSTKFKAQFRHLIIAARAQGIQQVQLEQWLAEQFEEENHEA
ncbi:GntR family transcriptional regulator [Lapidilactobacillus achengensis]|uniref:GntR family transcriptional regulator n=1 Tax=Lapidilactobacillus achengensis TaxID=2486000 RepID=A0ABW1UMY5_9LACO|nr:GntR family transcriptional regulator [Lapidilactobacillus achengensis]